MPLFGKPKGEQLTLNIEGMTCGHCVNAVTEELMAIPGVREVRVDLKADANSSVHVDSDAETDIELVRAAVDEAGYALAGESG